MNNQEQEKEPENILPAPGEINSKRWSWKNALTGGGLGFGGVVIFGELLAIFMGVEPGLFRIPVYGLVCGSCAVLFGIIAGDTKVKTNT